MKYTLLIVIALMWFCGFAQDDRVVIMQTSGSLTLDGILNEPLWNDAKEFKFHEFSPNWSVPDSLTTAYVTFDDQNLYVGLIAKEPDTEKIIIRNLIRDGWQGDDFFTFHIDPNMSGENALVFSIYPSGSRYDMSVSNDGVPLGDSTFNKSYDMIWEGQTNINDQGWSAEYKIPLSNLRLKVIDGKVLAAISAQRTQVHLNKTLVFPLNAQNIPNANMVPSLKLPIELKGLQPKKQFQFTPYVLGTLGNSFELNEGEYVKRKGNDFNVGGDLRLGLGSSLILDLTANTDFAQVEIDDQIVNVSDRVNIFLPEKRKFFQEQAGLFDFNTGIGSQLFYSRAIGINQGRLTPIIGGARLTGRLNDTDVGFLSLQTNKTNLDDLSTPSENFSVFRVRQKLFNDSSFLGFMATNRVNEDSYNTAFGIDGVISLQKNLFLIGSVSSEFSNHKNQFDLFDRSRISLLIDKRQEDKFFYRFGYEYSGDNYSPDMSFLLRSQHQNFYANLNYGRFNNDRRKHLFRYSRWTFLNSDVYFDTNLSKVITFYNRSFWRGSFFDGSSVSVFGQFQYESLESPIQLSDKLIIEEGDYKFAYFGLSYSPGNRYNLQFPISVEYGSFYDGANLKFRLQQVFNFGKHLNISNSWQSNYISFKERDLKDWIHIVQTKINWAYNLNLSGSLIGQYNSLNDTYLLSARMRYNFKDGNDLYVVFNQDYNTISSLDRINLPAYNSQFLTFKYTYTFL